MIYMDLSKAFDKFNHQLLILKLKNCFGITGKLLAWLRAVLSGVLQGSILGAILFLLYVNNLPDAVKQS